MTGAQKGGLYCRHRNNFLVNAHSPQGNLLCRDIQGGGNQISDDEEEGRNANGKRKSKVQVSTAKVTVRRSGRLKKDVNYNENDNTDVMLDSVDERGGRRSGSGQPKAR